MKKGLIVENSIFIDGPVSRVWDALVSPEIAKKYMLNCEAVPERENGRPLIWKGASDGKVYVKGSIQKIKRGKILQYTTFDPNGAMEDVPSNLFGGDIHTFAGKE
ncbi:MAG TPA: SRPBCC domain-containing protein [Candidatus Acidoferrales bacterium]|nr:SRPBCC domain-containing protein [Candidatus Acidoferrales bacterium]